MKPQLITFIFVGLVLLTTQNSFEANETEFKEKILSSFMNHPPRELFKIYHLLYKKQYDINSEEGLKRFETFMNTVRFIEETNEQNLSYKLGINDFSDLTNEEFRQLYLGYKDDFESSIKFLDDSPHAQLIDSDLTLENDTNDITAGIDYSSYFGPVKNQGSCGSCWSFGPIGAIEANYAKSFGNKLRFSEQNLVDCTTSAYGCNGGDPKAAMKYIADYGVAYEAAYPYTSGKTGNPGTCKANLITPNFVLNKYEYCSPSNCTRAKVKAFLAKGPLSVAMDAGGSAFKSYKSGILSMPCSAMNHAIIMTGNDFDSNNKEYYRARNSWGSGWGEKGYFRIYLRDSDKTCFMESYVILPTVKETKAPTPPAPVSDCLKIYSKCSLQGTMVEVCKSKTTLSIVPTGFTIGKFDQANFYMKINCTGSYYSLTSGIDCFATSGITSSLKSIMIIDNLLPPTGCIWVYNDYCLSGEKKEICSSISDLKSITFSKVISSVEYGPGLTNVRLYTDVNYSGTYVTITSNKVSLSGSSFDKSIESIKFDA